MKYTQSMTAKDCIYHIPEVHVMKSGQSRLPLPSYHQSTLKSGQIRIMPSNDGRGNGTIADITKDSIVDIEKYQKAIVIHNEQKEKLLKRHTIKVLLLTVLYLFLPLLLIAGVVLLIWHRDDLFP